MKRQGKILIVDDEANFTKLLEAFLKQRGYQTATATEGKQVFGMIERFSPDLILLDLGLPDIPGDVLALRIKSQNGNIPILALTGHGDPLTEATTRAVGFEDYVQKPFDADDLIHRIERFLGELK